MRRLVRVLWLSLEATTLAALVAAFAVWHEGTTLHIAALSVLVLSASRRRRRRFYALCVTVFSAAVVAFVVDVGPQRDTIETIETSVLLALAIVIYELAEGRHRMSERLETARELDRLEQLELAGQLVDAQRMQSLAFVASSLCHDFNNILGVVLSCAEDIADDVAPDHPAQLPARDLELAVERGRTLVTELHAITRPRVTIENDVVHIDDAIRNLEPILTRLAGRGNQLSTNPGAAGVAVKMSTTMLSQVLVNLVVNAQDALGTGGQIAVTTLSTDDENVQISVRDNGRGMSQETLEAAFEPYFTTKAQAGGTGLGLYSVQQIVERAGGTATISSQIGLGTAVTIDMPAIASDERGRAVQRHPSSRPQAPAMGPLQVAAGHRRLLLVEDDPVLLRSWSQMLRKQGHRVFEAGGVTAAAELNISSIDVLVTDVDLGDGDGVELARALLDAETVERVVIVTANGAHEATVRLARPAAVGLDKPFSHDVLLRAVETQLKLTRRSAS